MTKNKGSFWKNNIKKIKKERKERSIKQEAQKKKARIKIEAQKKAREEIERKESKRLLQEEAERKEIQKTYEKEQEEEAKRIREAKEEAERKEIQKTYGKEQEPELNYEHKLLLDTMIVYDIFTDNMDVITKLKNYEGSSNLLFLVLRRIIIEFQNMMKDKFGESVQYDKVIEKLSLLGKVEVISHDHNSPLARKATELSESGKYYNEKTGVDLSETDCFLLQFAIEKSCTLVTSDKALIDATIENGGEVFNPREI